MGYRVTLWKNGKGKDYLVARLVATTFLENLIDTNMTVNHKNGNRLDNRIENLEWLSRGDNIRYGFDNNQFHQINIVLESNNKLYKFSSLSKANNFLKRYNGYITQCLKNNKKITNKDNIEYSVVSLNKV